MILQRYEEPFASLTPEEVACLTAALSLAPFPTTGRPWTGPDIMAHCRENHISHADVIMSLASDRSVAAVAAVERLIMRPVDRRTPYEVNISRLPRPPGSHREKGTTPRSGPGNIPDTHVIRLLAETNPKKPGSESHTRFAKYRDGITVGEFIAAGGRRPDLNWDQEKGFIRIEDGAAS